MAYILLQANVEQALRRWYLTNITTNTHYFQSSITGLKKFFLTCWRAAASCSSLSASENFINHWARGLSLVSPLFLLLVSSTGTVRKQEVNLSIQRKVKSTTGSRQLRYLLGGGKVKPAGNLGTFTAGWLCTRAKKPSEGSGNTISSYDSTTTGFLIDEGSSSGYNFKWWYLWIT